MPVFPTFTVYINMKFRVFTTGKLASSSLEILICQMKKKENGVPVLPLAPVYENNQMVVS